MSFPFNPSRGPVLVEAEFSGPLGRNNARLVLDTGATTSMINILPLVASGYDPDQSARKVDIETGNGIITAPLIILNRLTALGQHRIGFSVAAGALPSGIGIDGLLGLDFLRGHVLTLDFQCGQIALV
jgi:predicted aspartyl protease